MINVLPTNPLTYRWIILAVSFLLITVTNGLTLGGLYVFEEEIMKSLSQITGEDVLRADLKLRDAITLWSTAVFGFFAGAAAEAKDQSLQGAPADRVFWVPALRAVTKTNTGVAVLR